MSSVKVTVETVGAVIDGNPIGSTIEINGRSAKALEAIGYVRILPTPTPVKKEAAPKKPVTKAKVTPKTKAPAKDSVKTEDKPKGK